jgi:endo-1,4-beta-mannosidase
MLCAVPAEHTSGPFRLGVNYWPASSAMAWWSRFDRAEVTRDIERVAATGMDSVRLFLLWEAFQPSSDGVDREMLVRLVEVADIAEAAGVRIVPTLFTGHMSGVNWIPGWALGGSRRDPRFRVVSGGRVVAEGLRDWFTDGEIGRAQALLAREGAAALAGHPALWAWDLGNEHSNCVVPPDRERARRWLGQMTAAIRGADPGALVTIGLHMEDLEQDRLLGPREAAEVCDLLTMHGYPIYASWSEGPLDQHLVPFLACITRWLGGGADVLFSEFGLPTLPVSDGDARPGTGPMLVAEADAATYTAQVLDGLREAGCVGAMLWCYADYDPALWAAPPLDEAPHERTFGLWRADGTPKPAVAEIAGFAGRGRLESPSHGWIDVDQGEYWRDPGAHLARLYGRYRSRPASLR